MNSLFLYKALKLNTYIIVVTPVNVGCQATKEPLILYTHTCKRRKFILIKVWNTYMIVLGVP